MDKKANKKNAIYLGQKQLKKLYFPEHKTVFQNLSKHKKIENILIHKKIN